MVVWLHCWMVILLIVVLLNGQMVSLLNGFIVELLDNLHV